MINPFLSQYLDAVKPSTVDIIIQVPTEELSTVQNFLKNNNIQFASPIITGRYAFLQAVVPATLVDKISELPGVSVHVNELKKATVHIELSMQEKKDGKSILPPITFDQTLPVPINPFRFNPQIFTQFKGRYLPSEYNSVFGPVQYKFMDEIYPRLVDVEKTTLDGTGIKLAVIDTGYSPTEPQGIIRKGGMPKLIVLSSLDPGPVDMNGHGSWCTNTAAGGIWSYFPFGPGAGIAPGTEVYAIKVLSAYGSGTTYDVINGMKFAAMNLKVDVASMSLGGPVQGTVETDPTVIALEDLVEHSKTMFVVASGDSGEYGKLSTMDSPAVAPDAISVASISLTDEELDTSPETHNVAYWSSAGGPDYPWAPTCAAYGGGRAMPNLTPDELIYNGLSQWGLLDGLYNGIRGLGQEGLHGTSQSTPQVAGLIALLIQAGLIEGETGKERTKYFINKLASKSTHNFFSGYGVPKLSYFI